ncbi:MAG: SDR family NAD(P)-dependent oxidoreductase [Pseudomonadota bacterium]
MDLVVITGASSGVGAATARAVAETGAQVVLVARNAEALRRIAGQIGKGAVVEPCDASDWQAVDRMAGDVFDNYGTPDVIINCAGAGQWKTLPETSATEAAEMMGAPYFAALHTTKAFLPRMLEKDRGTILHVNSPACIAPWPSSVGYAGARAALRGFHAALAQDLHGTGVQSCHVIFGKISSEYFDHNPGVEDQMPRLTKIIPTLTPEACAARLVRLARQPRYEAIYPGMLRLLLMSGALAPPLTRWLARL